MDTHISIMEDVSQFLIGLVNKIDRTKVVMINAYPSWDETDIAEFKAATITSLNQAITKVSGL